jgi:Flp pilus assembly protein TadD
MVVDIGKRKVGRRRISAGFILLLLLLFSIRYAASAFYERLGSSLLYNLPQEYEIEEPGFYCISRQEVDTKRSIKALRFLETASFLWPSNDRLYLLLGRTHCITGNSDQAITSYTAYTELRPHNPLGYIELGFAYERLCTTGVSATGLSWEPGKGAYLCPNPFVEKQMVDAWKKGGVVSQNFWANGSHKLQGGNYSEAGIWFIRAEALGMSYRSDHWYQIYIYMKNTGSTDQAWIALEEATYQDNFTKPEWRLEAWLAQGSIMLDQQRHEEAIAAFEKALEANETLQLKYRFAEVYRLLGGAYWAIGDLEKAEQYMKAALERNEESIWAHIHYGKVLYLLSPENEALTTEHFLSAVQIDYNHINTWQNLIDFWYWVDNRDQAALWCERAIERVGAVPEITSRCQPDK